MGRAVTVEENASVSVSSIREWSWNSLAGAEKFKLKTYLLHVCVGLGNKASGMPEWCINFFCSY